MPRFILICEASKHACFVSRDEIVQLIDIRFNPQGGYTEVERCIAMIANPEGGRYMPFPFRNRMGAHTIHVEGRMDLPNHLVWRPPGHRCTPKCLLPAGMQGHDVQSIFGRRRRAA